MDERWKISDQIKDIRATTEAGRCAKASVAVVLLRENHVWEECAGSQADAFAYATLLDLAGSATG